MHGEIIAKELKEKVNEGKGCIIFDIGCFYNPYDYENIYNKMILAKPSVKFNFPMCSR